ncbi:sensor histidine kinase [Ornithinimicrobium sp. W1665]
MRTALAGARHLTGARAAVLTVEDEEHPGWVAQVLTDGVAPDDPVVESLTASAPHDGPEAVLHAPVVVGGLRYGSLHVVGVPPTAGRAAPSCLRLVATVLGLRLGKERQRQVAGLYEAVAGSLWAIDRTIVEQVDLEVTLPLLTDRARELTGARAVALVGTRPDGELRVLAASGPEAGAALAELGPDLREVMADGSPHHWTTTRDPVSLAATATPRTSAAGPDPTERSSTSLVPLDTRAGLPVVLVAHRWAPAPGVSAQQVRDVISALALHATLVLDREHGERDHDLVTLLQDRDRIARDLHDLVIQRLFAVGLTLQGSARHSPDAEIVERLDGAVAELDQTIRDIRATIFELRHHPGAGSFRADLRQLVESYASTLGFAPVVHLRGPLDTVADEEVHTQVLMVVREALSNVARHARATSVVVTAEVLDDPSGLRLVVRDDGVGIGSDVAESGLGNVRARARERDGAVRLRRVEPHGTELTWSVPL